MPKIFVIILIILIFSSQNCVAQELSFTQLLSLNKTNIDSFDTYINELGYRFYKLLLTVSTDTAVIYAYCQNDSTLKAEHFVKKYLSNKKEGKTISYQTTCVLEYLRMKQDIKNEGFTENGCISFTEDIGLSLLFIKKDIKIYLSSLMGNTDQNKKIPVYEITIINTK